METVRVLMSTYNGEKFLKEQIETILNQEGVKIDLLVRDDGSKDSTKEILEQYKQQGKLDWYLGENLRSAKSFMDLVKNSGDYEYYAFADQDDYWKSKKLYTAIEQLQKLEKDKPAVYFCNKELVDTNLNHIEHENKKFVISFESAMMRNIATGCTMVMNKKLIQIINSYTPEYVVMHDSWIYRVCLALDGNCIFDEGEHIKYRQHENNVIGAQEGIMNMLKRRFNTLIHPDYSRQKTAIELLKGYREQISPEKVELLEYFEKYKKGFKYKFKLINNSKFKTESLEKNIAFRMAVLINRM